ncbi:hypothetical protein ESCO_004382 [Escovopsis weberi]|uniref:Uncharacterized protein n=1 Tax=Escovopsis weberi TaxID=150374 RepID=A0A0M9VVH2_ESCWE|nr:hypothetical protein ESCO_004382 [Escovopsis weberi]
MEVLDGAGEPPNGKGREIFVDYCFEIQFLVAKERSDLDYSNMDDDRSDISDNDISQLRWVCPADEKDPLRAILNRCKNLLLQNNEPVTICYDPAYPDIDLRVFDAEMAENPDRLGHWHLEPCSTARVKKGGPPEYDWFGIRLRSPLYPETELENPASTVKWALGALRMGVTMHVNSTCRFNVRVQPDDGPMTLLAAKKLTTLVWVVERDLLLRLCPSSQGVHWRHVKPIDSHSRIAAARWKGHVESTRPEDPLRAGIMDQYLPPLHDKVVQERLHDVWAAASTRELAKALCCNDGSPASFAILAPPDEPAAGSAGGPAAEFRYALWHPYSTLDASHYWIQLAVSLFKATAHGSFDFKDYVRAIDRIIKGFVSGVAPSARWKILLDKLHLSEDWATPWERIVDEYKDGRLLGYPSIDRHPVLDQIDELKQYKP